MKAQNPQKTHICVPCLAPFNFHYIYILFVFVASFKRRDQNDPAGITECFIWERREAVNAQNNFNRDQRLWYFISTGDPTCGSQNGGRQTSWLEGLQEVTRMNEGSLIQSLWRYDEFPTCWESGRLVLRVRAPSPWARDRRPTTANHVLLVCRQESTLLRDSICVIMCDNGILGEKWYFNQSSNVRSIASTPRQRVFTCTQGEEFHRVPFGLKGGEIQTPMMSTQNARSRRLNRPMTLLRCWRVWEPPSLREPTH